MLSDQVSSTSPWIRSESDANWDYRNSNYSINPTVFRETGMRKKDGMFIQANAETKEKAIELLESYTNCDCSEDIRCEKHKF